MATTSETTPALPSYPQMLGHPKPLWMLFMSEFWERFCFYGMRWMLALYIVAQFYGGEAIGEKSANDTYGAYLALVYATAILGGQVADRILGFQRTVLLGAAFISVGLFVLLVPTQAVFMYGLSLVIVGNGMFKPNISSMVGQLYAQGDPRRDRGFTLFYMGINAGGLVAPLVTGYVAAKFGYFDGAGVAERANGLRIAFAVAGLGMVISWLWFFFGRRQLLGVGRPPAGAEGYRRLLLVTLGGLALSPLIYFLLHHNEWLAGMLAVLFAGCCVALVAAGLKDGPVQRDRIFALLILFTANVLFWMFFEQAGGSFNFLAEKVVDRDFGGWEFPVGWFQSVNPLAIVVLAPLVTIVWGWLDRRNLEPSIPRKFGIGLIGNALGFLVLVIALKEFVSDAGLIPFSALALCYVMQTVGELHLSPIGLSMVTKLAPARMVGVTMGAWFLSIAIGNSLAGALGKWISAEGGEQGLTVATALSGYTFGFWLLLGIGVLVLAVAPLINRLTHGVR
ncbi:amino acid/peptide transporter [Mizugakiibacter sediminis]|uniref:Amino acid/peptide transporter n=1 Tax=Mizugakiibacter sediminis TaxID=1475481 RepID=A0A0K8QKK5_9GAMM|nr:oligopeptide:H+ symporter [Mizugakiibacter sediminis]GAP65191.1 amino acid/peptide transporter [Mizugakiibacter sediminis]